MTQTIHELQLQKCKAQINAPQPKLCQGLLQEDLVDPPNNWVKITDDYKSLCSDLTVRLEEIQHKLAKDYAMRVDDMNRHALWHQFFASFYKLLPKVANVFIAQ